MQHRSVSEVGTPGQCNLATPASTVPYGANTPPPNSMPGRQAAEDAHISSGSLPPPSGGHNRQHSQASSLSELRRREIATGQATKLRQIAQLRLAAAEAEAAEFEAQMAEELARSASSNAHSSRLHAGNQDTHAEEQRLPIHDSSQDRPMIAPQPQRQQITAAKAGPSAAKSDSKVKGRSGIRSPPLPLPSRAPTSQAPSGKGFGYQIPER